MAGQLRRLALTLERGWATATQAYWTSKLVKSHFSKRSEKGQSTVTMAGLVGVKNAFDVFLASEDVSSRFKQEALLLDKIAFHGFELVREAESVSKELLSEFLWLQEQGIIFIPPAPKDRKDIAEALRGDLTPDS